MTVKRAGLGRNLSALLGTPSAVAEAKSAMGSDGVLHTGTPLALPIQQLKPGQYQPRRVFDEAPLQELAHSIKQQGLLQPLLVRPIAHDRYEILAGERRWRACKLAGLTDVPVIIKTVSDEEALVIALIENLQREDLTVLESARAMEQLMRDYALTHQQVADLLSKSRSHVSNHLRLLALPEAVQSHLDQGHMEMGHARALLMLDPSLQQEAVGIIIAKKLSVRATEQLVERLKSGEAVSQAVAVPQAVRQVEKQLVDKLNTKVEIKLGRAGKGKLVIHYDNQERLDSLIERLQA